MKVNDHRLFIGTSMALPQTLWTSIHKQNVMTISSTGRKRAVKTLLCPTWTYKEDTAIITVGQMPNKGMV
jgi:hypothetical protein